MTDNTEENKTPDAGRQIVEKAFGSVDPDILKVLFAAQNTEGQRGLLSSLFGQKLDK